MSMSSVSLSQFSLDPKSLQALAAFKGLIHNLKHTYCPVVSYPVDWFHQLML